MAERHGDFIIVSCLDPIERGVISRIPRHVTLVPWFHMPLDELVSLQHEIRGVAGRHEALEVRGSDVKRFGPDEDILVRELTDEAESICRLHLDLLSTVIATRGILRSPQYTGANYSPHVTKQADGWIDEGEVITLGSFQLAQAVDTPRGTRDIINNYDFKG